MSLLLKAFRHALGIHGTGDGSLSHTITIYKMEAVDYIDYSDGEFVEEKMLIGFFDSLATCRDVEDDYKNLPGFSLASCKFAVTPYSLPTVKDRFVDQVFFVQEWVYDERTGEESITEIGVFSTLKEAETEKAKYLALKNQNKDQTSYNESIYIDAYKINERHWTEGFTRE